MRKKWPSLASTGSVPQYHLEEESRKSPHFRVCRIPNLKRFTCEMKTFNSRLSISNSWHTPGYCYLEVHEFQDQGLFGAFVSGRKPRSEGAGLACHGSTLFARSALFWVALRAIDGQVWSYFAVSRGDLNRDRKKVTAQTLFSLPQRARSSVS